MMLSEPDDADQSKLLRNEESKAVAPITNDNKLEPAVVVTKVLHSGASVLSSNERLTPANEYDVAIDSAKDADRLLLVNPLRSAQNNASSNHQTGSTIV